MFPKTASAHQIQRKYRDIFNEVMRTKEPIVVLNNNIPEVVIVDVHEFDALREKMEAMELELAIHAVEVARKEKKEGKLKKLKSLADLMN
jgi:prevent-host-death family protein